MDAKTLLNADYLDILFDNRNKKYGGYELRKHYNKRMFTAISFLLATACVSICSSFITTGKEQPPHKIASVIKYTSVNIKPFSHYNEKPPTAKTSVHKAVKTVANTIPKIEKDPAVAKDWQPAKNDDLKNIQIGSINSTGDTVSDDVSGLTGETGKTKAREYLSTPKKYVPQMPEFNGDINEYIARHIHYPDEARQARIEGRVAVRFVVNEDGSISDIELYRSIGASCDQEAMNLVKNMPRWKPGKQNGVPVKVFFILPIKFELQ